MRLQKSASQSFSLPLEMLERLDAISHQLRIPKSRIVQAALRRELERYADVLKVDDGQAVGSGGVMVEPAASRS